MSALDRPLVLLAVLAYFAWMIGIGVWAARRTRHARDFFIAGQRVGLVATGLGTMSAAFSGFVFLGGPGLTWRLGIAALWIVLPVGFTSGLLCHVLGRKLRQLAGAREIYTVPDVVACRFPGRGAHALAAAAVATGSVAYLGSQLLALGVLLQAILGIERLWPAMALGLGVMLAYSVVGGMVAGVYTDVAQGVIMLAAASGVFVQALRVTGGWRAATASIAASEAFGPGFLAPFGAAGALTAFGFFFVFGVGVLGQPQMLHRFFMIDRVERLRFLPAVLGGSQALCLLIWVGIGLAVPALVAQGRLAPLARADDAATVFLLDFAPEALAGLAFAGVLAAIMSTSDSFLNIGSAALVRDLPRALGRPVADELVWGRLAVPVIGLAAVALALAYGDLIALLGTFAFGTFAAGLAPTLAVGLNWRGVTSRAAAASIATGVGLNLGLELLLRQTRFPSLRPPIEPGAVPSALALAASFVVLVAVSFAGPADPAPAEDLRAVLDE